MCNKDERIVKTLLEHAKGKLCSRYVLGLARALDSIQQGTPKQALDEQRDWVLSKYRRAQERKNKEKK